MDLIRHIRDKMMKEHLVFVYRGVVTNENSVPLLMLLEKEMEDSEFGVVGRKRLFMFVLESLQNVSRHSRQSQHADMSLVVYSRTANRYTVTTGNAISSYSVDSLKLKLDEINNLETDEIRSVYRQMLSTAEFSNKGGAGLGLIEMAKKTGNKLDYDFIPLDNEDSYFILSKTVDRGGIGIHSGVQEQPFRGKAAIQLQSLMAENDIYMIWSGHISPDVGKEVLSFTETNLAEDDINIRKRVFSILVEMLENVAKFSTGREPEELLGMPVAIIKMENKTYSLTTGNLILNKNIEHLKEKIDTINRYDIDGLKELFKVTLSGQTISSESTGNMGLIDMAKKAGNKLIYKFETIDDTYSYFTLTVKVEDSIS
ncbi:MAG: SiaB family protein kinase [Bacteroidales bacterium]|nr:SiaB family protein kinase [Bacteroidales bacterium]